MSSSGLNTGAGSYDQIAEARGGEGLDIDAETAGRTDGRGEGFSTGAGEEDNIPGQGLDGGPGGEDIQAAQAGRGEGLSAGNRGSDRPGGGVSLNAGRDEEFNNSGHKRFFDAESRVQDFADKIRDKFSSNKS